jgi:flagellar basal body-associated protein FliL
LQQPSPSQSQPNQLVIVVIFVVIVVVVIVMMMMVAMLAAHVMTMDPMVTVLGPMARDPSHFPIVIPVGGTVTIIGPIPDFDVEGLRLDGSRENKAQRDNRHEQKCFLNHKV